MKKNRWKVINIWEGQNWPKERKSERFNFVGKSEFSESKQWINGLSNYKLSKIKRILVKKITWFSNSDKLNLFI